MFDPSVFENLKVVLEGAIYDRDLHGEITVKNRKDIVDLATMGREFVISFVDDRVGEDYIASITLTAGMQDFVEEKLNGNEDAGCTIYLSFQCESVDESKSSEKGRLLHKLWGNQTSVTQTVSYKHDEEQDKTITFTIDFNRKITEDNIDDLSELIDATIESIEVLSK